MARIEDEMQSTFTNERHRMMFSIVFTGSWITSNFNEVIKPYGVSSQQFNILRILRGAGEWLAMNEVKKRMVDKSPNATRLCDKLVSKGLVERGRSEEDRRVVHLKIAEKGLALLSKIDEEDDGSHMAYMQNVTEEEATTLADLLEKLRG
jgi:DNA-binding MarR family transcriptional regulator